MTADQRTITSVVTDLLSAVPAVPARVLHVAEPLSRFLYDAYAKSIQPAAAEALLGLPIVVDADLTGGQWQLREDGEVHTAGDMAPAPEGMTVSCSPLTGWIAIETDLLESMGWELQ